MEFDVNPYRNLPRDGSSKAAFLESSFEATANLIEHELKNGRVPNPAKAQIMESIVKLIRVQLDAARQYFPEERK